MMYAVHKQQARFISSSIPCHLSVLFEDVNVAYSQWLRATSGRLAQAIWGAHVSALMCHDSRRRNFSALFLSYRASLVTQRTSSCTANQFQLSWVPHLTWPTATIHGNKRNTYVSCPCAPYEGTLASRGIDQLTNLGTIWRWLVKLHPPASLPLGKEPCVATTGWAGRRVGLEKGKNSWICRESKHNYS